MKDVTRQEAIDSISTVENLLVLFHHDSCKICDKFIPQVLESVEPDVPHVTMVKVNSTEEEKLFGPDSYPSTFCFKDGTRIDWIKGSAPLDAVRDKLLELFPLDTEGVALAPSEDQGDTQPDVQPDVQPGDQGNEG